MLGVVTVVWCLVATSDGAQSGPSLSQLLEPFPLSQFWSDYHQHRPMHCRSASKVDAIKSVWGQRDLETYLWAQKNVLSGKLGEQALDAWMGCFW